jgi:uncharacterized protein involved in exopolysaccharide biosynthesis
MNVEKSQQLNEPIDQQDELTLKDIVAKLSTLKKLFFQKIKIIFGIAFLGGFIGVGYAFLTKPTYTAKLTFVMRADANGSAISGLAGLSSLLGSGTSAASASPLDRIIELLGSEQIIGKALLKTGVVEGKQDLYVNHLIRIAELSSKWQKDTVLARAKFDGNLTFDQLNYPQRKAIKILTSMLVGPKGILQKSFDKKSGVISTSVVFTHEELAIHLTKAVYNELVTFYTNESVASIASKVEVVRQKIDSIQGALNYTQQTSAVKSDQGLGLLLQQDRVDQKRLGLKEGVLTIMYGEAQKNLQQLELILATTSPSFNIIDQPYSPIQPLGRSNVKFGLIGFVLSAMFTFIFIWGRIWFKTLVD